MPQTTGTEEHAAASAPCRALRMPWREPELASPAPGVILLRLAAGDVAGQAIGAVAEEDVRTAWAALRRRDAMALALALPEDDAPIEAAAGLIGLAALDLAAQALGLPAALLLGAAAAPPPAPVATLPSPLPPGWRGLPRGGAAAAALREALLDPATLLILADPAEAGGPAGLRRLSAAARAFQVEVALAPAVAHPLAVAAAAHLRAGLGWPASRPVYLPAGPAPPPDLAWTDPAAPGFGWGVAP